MTSSADCRTLRPSLDRAGASAVPYRGTINAGPQALRRAEPMASAAPAPVALASPRSYLELVALAAEKRDILLKTALETQMRPVAFREKAVEVALVEGADPAIVHLLSGRLREWTGTMWGVSVARTPATGPTIRDVRDRHRATAEAEAADDPLVKAILESFPGASVSVTLREDEVPDAAYEEAFMEEREDE